MDNLFSDFMVLSTLSAMAGLIPLVMSARKKGIASNVISAVFYALAAGLRAFAVHNEFSPVDIFSVDGFFVVAACIAVGCNFSILISKLRLDRKR